MYWFVPDSNVSNLSKAWYLQVLPLNEANSKPFTLTLEIFSAVVIPLIVISQAVVENSHEEDGRVKPKSVASTQNVVTHCELVLEFVWVVFITGAVFVCVVVVQVGFQL